jgi:hypothetical protein
VRDGIDLVEVLLDYELCQRKPFSIQDSCLSLQGTAAADSNENWIAEGSGVGRAVNTAGKNGAVHESGEGT